MDAAVEFARAVPRCLLASPLTSRVNRTVVFVETAAASPRVKPTRPSGDRTTVTKRHTHGGTA